jgi:ribosomal protein S6--L-glutamate ligase
LISCKAPVVDERRITSSNGHRENRYVIKTLLQMGEQCWEIELTLSNRDPLRYRMLLGREAINNRVLIHPGITCNQGKRALLVGHPNCPGTVKAK